MRYLTFICLVATFTFSCKTKKDTTVANSNIFNVSDSTVVASLRTTGCFGKCPTYHMEIRANGYATLRAIQFTKLEAGQYEYYIDSAILSKLKYIADSINYLSFDNIYTNPYVADKPSVFTSYYHPERDSLHTVERIVDYPKEIMLYEDLLKEIYRTSYWNKVSTNY